MVGKFLKEYSDVFPTYLLSLSPAKKIDHAIDLIVDAKPISKAPYQLSFIEYEELEQQLNDFINKGHISPVNPLGVLMFYS
jgi:hypothetical protein